MATHADRCGNRNTTEDSIKLEIKRKHEEFHVYLEEKEFKIIKTDNGFNVFEKLDTAQANSLLEKIKTKEEEKMEINKQKYEEEHCDEIHAQAPEIPCPLPREEVVKLFESVGLTPPSPDSSTCTPPTAIM